MKKICARCLALLLLFSAAVYGEEETRVLVVGQRVNLRAKADMQSEVVGQVVDGDELLAKSFQDDWVEVRPPDTTDLWVHKEFIKDNAVLASKKLYVRAGPGINFTVVGSLSRGDTISPRGEFGEWIKISPPPSCSLWVNRSYVQVVTPAKPETRGGQAPLNVQPVKLTPPRVETAAPSSGVDTNFVASPVVSPEPATPMTTQAFVVPSDLVLIPLEGQGKTIQREGILRKSGFIFGGPSRFRLTRYQGNRLETICFVRGNTSQLTSFLGYTLLIRGREYWVKGVQYPVVVPEQLVPRLNP